MKDLTPRFWVGIKGEEQQIMPDDEKGLNAEEVMILRAELINHGYRKDEVLVIGVYEESKKK